MKAYFVVIAKLSAHAVHRGPGGSLARAKLHSEAERGTARHERRFCQCLRVPEYRAPLTSGIKPPWEIIADKISKAGWSLGCVSAVDRDGRTIWIADAHRGDGKRFIVHADEKLTAFLELERAIHEFAVSLIS